MASAHDLLKPSFLLLLRSAQTEHSLEANHHCALLPRCRQLSLFLSNVTLCCVTMATAGHHSEECHGETGRGKNGSRAEPLLVTGNFWGGKRASSHFMEGETEEQTKALLSSWEWRSKPPNLRTTPCTGSMLPCRRGGCSVI